MSPAIGIDLGTTTSRVAILHMGKPVIIENSEGEGTTPSHIAVTDDGKRLVGEAARRYALQAPESVAFAVKRLIGRRFSDDVVKKIARYVPYKIVEADNGDAWVELSGKKFAPSQLLALMLMKMKQTAEEFLGEPAGKAVITVPAFFNEAQRQATIDAGRIAGLDVLRIVPEPMAGALHYGYGRSKEWQLIAVYDLGGGTFDFSILEISDGIFEVKSTAGDTFLGGEDFDYVLAEHLADRFRRLYGVDILSNPFAQQRVKQAAETAKIDLSSNLISRVDLPFIVCDNNRFLHLADMLDRATCESLLRPFIDRTVIICNQALKDAGCKPSEIQSVVLVGGSTRMPIVKQRLTELFGKPPIGGLRREDAVALGAAVQAAVLTGSLRDVLLLSATSFSLGIETLGGVFTRLVDRNTTIPTKKAQTFSTAEDNQEAVTIRILQGEREMAADNVLLGVLELSGIPPAPRGVPQIEVTFSVGPDGMLEVFARDETSKQERSVRIRANSGLTEDQVFAMSRDMVVAGVANFEVRPSLKHETSQVVVREEPNEPPSSGVPSSGGPSPRKPSIFVSYAREDKAYAEKLLKAFALSVREGQMDMWADRAIGAGEEWEKSIFSAIQSCNVAILLLSMDFLESEFIAKKELPSILAEKERRQLLLFPIVVRPCPLEMHGLLAKFQLFNLPEHPFASLKEWEMEAELVRLVREIAKAAA